MSGIASGFEDGHESMERRVRGRAPLTEQSNPINSGSDIGHQEHAEDEFTDIPQEELGREFDDEDPGREYEDAAAQEIIEEARGETGESERGDFARLSGPRIRRNFSEDDPRRNAPLIGKAKSRALHKPEPRTPFTAQQRMLILDIWLRSNIPAGEFAPLVGLATHTLYSWRKRFEENGPAGLADHPRGAPSGSRLPATTRRAICMLKQSHPEWGVQRIHDVLLRSEGYSAGTDAIARVLHEEGYVFEEQPTHPHKPKVQFFERARPNQLWQTDLFTFTLKRENKRVHLVAFMDDHSRFIVGFGLHASALGAPVREVFEAAIANYGAPEEVLTDNGSQYRTWRGKSAFARLCERRGIHQIVAAPRHPQTLGKAERFWGTLWRECLESAIFQGIDDARRRIGLFIDYYNFQRPHQGIDGHVPADRFFNAAPEVHAKLKARVAENALELARHGEPRKTVYLTGKVGDVGVSIHSEGDKVILLNEKGEREEVNLAATGKRAEPVQATTLPPAVSVQGTANEHPAHQAPAQRVPGASSLDAGLEELRGIMDPKNGGEA